MITYLDVQNLQKSVGDRILFHDVCFSIGEGQHVGLIAKNGTGKSTLLNILSGKEDYDDGTLVYRNDIKVGYLEQTPHFDPNLSVLQSCLSQAPLTLENPELRAKQLLTQLKLEEIDKPIGLLSGGQIKRVALAAVLLEDPDLLILDEPTNHLDLDMIEWLENYLRRNTKALLMVTHDRYFLDRICSIILELDDETMYTYHGNYQYYLEKRDARVLNTNANIAKAQNLYRKELDWMRRMPQARGGKARYRKEAFYELEQQAKRRQEEKATRLEVKSGYIGTKIFEAEYVSKTFEGTPEKPTPKVILNNFYYNFSRYEKMGIVGNNGTGKSTFIKMLLGKVKPDSGRFSIGETVRFGYFSQEGMEFDSKMKVIDSVRQYAEYIDLGGGRKLSALQFLTHFLFPPQRQQDYVYKLSGGERRRLYLCTVLMQNPNFLILDEPTNDLDIATLQILEEYLENFKGCVIVVSHDRYFMDKVVDHLLVFKGEGIIDDFPGNYSQYRQWAALPENAPEQVAEQITTNKKYVSVHRRRLTFKEKKELEKLEHDLKCLEQEKNNIEAALCSGTLSVEELTEKSKRLPQLETELEEKEMRWLELSEIEQ